VIDPLKRVPTRAADAALAFLHHQQTDYPVCSLFGSIACLTGNGKVERATELNLVN